jgi:hypothetical protein
MKYEKSINTSSLMITVTKVPILEDRRRLINMATT